MLEEPLEPRLAAPPPRRHIVVPVLAVGLAKGVEEHQHTVVDGRATPLVPERHPRQLRLCLQQGFEDVRGRSYDERLLGVLRDVACQLGFKPRRPVPARCRHPEGGGGVLDAQVQELSPLLRPPQPTADRRRVPEEHQRVRPLVGIQTEALHRRVPPEEVVEERWIDRHTLCCLAQPRTQARLGVREHRPKVEKKVQHKHRGLGEHVTARPQVVRPRPVGLPQLEEQEVHGRVRAPAMLRHEVQEPRDIVGIDVVEASMGARPDTCQGVQEVDAREQRGVGQEAMVEPQGAAGCKDTLPGHEHTVRRRRVQVLAEEGLGGRRATGVDCEGLVRPLCRLRGCKEGVVVQRRRCRAVRHQGVDLCGVALKDGCAPLLPC